MGQKAAGVRVKALVLRLFLALAESGLLTSFLALSPLCQNVLLPV